MQSAIKQVTFDQYGNIATVEFFEGHIETQVQCLEYLIKQVFYANEKFPRKIVIVDNPVATATETEE